MATEHHPNNHAAAGYAKSRFCANAARRLASFALAAFLLPGCVQVPDQQPYAPLYTLRDTNTALVRLYIGPVNGVEDIATHPWFVVKTAGSNRFDRWEIVSFAEDSPIRYQTRVRAENAYGNVYHNLLGPDEYYNGNAYVYAERTGPAAEPIVDFIQNESPNYPCRHEYVLFPGPNSNTYAQWVLDNTGWDIELPPSAIGRDVPVDCP